ncbi:MAG: DinB family protein [Armatimonadetes bacterium]|nr:DinB family protein [Armatimonadota bacterium]
MQEWMLNAFSKGPHIVERILRVFPHDRLDDRIERDRFTAREVIGHLSDYEQTVLERIRVANMKPGTSVEAYDADARNAEHKFATKDVFHEAEVFETRRGMTLEYLSTLSPECWDKTFVKPDGTAISIREYIGFALAHDMEHIDQLSLYLATEVATIV